MRQELYDILREAADLEHGASDYGPTSLPLDVSSGTAYLNVVDSFCLTAD